MVQTVKDGGHDFIMMQPHAEPQLNDLLLITVAG